MYGREDVDPPDLHARGRRAQLRTQLQTGKITEQEEHDRLGAIEAQLDQLWDLLRRRRAASCRRRADQVQAHTLDEVEHYLQYQRPTAARRVRRGVPTAHRPCAAGEQASRAAPQFVSCSLHHSCRSAAPPLRGGSRRGVAHPAAPHAPRRDARRQFQLPYRCAAGPGAGFPPAPPMVRRTGPTAAGPRSHDPAGRLTTVR